MEAREPRHEVVPLQREVEFMRLYLELMDRPGRPVYFDFLVADLVAGYSIPPTNLITLTENACKHGITDNPEYPIRIQLRLTDGVMRFTCRNRIKGMKDRRSHGVGLANLRRWLEIIYDLLATGAITYIATYTHLGAGQIHLAERPATKEIYT